LQSLEGDSDEDAPNKFCEDQLLHFNYSLTSLKTITISKVALTNMLESTDWSTNLLVRLCNHSLQRTVRLLQPQVKAHLSFHFSSLILGNLFLKTCMGQEFHGMQLDSNQSSGVRGLEHSNNLANQSMSYWTD